MPKKTWGIIEMMNEHRAGLNRVLVAMLPEEVIYLLESMLEKLVHLALRVVQGYTWRYIHSSGNKAFVL